MHGMKSRILTSVLLTAGILAIGASAQPGGGAPVCCKYNYSWPNGGENDCGLDGNSTATSCEDSSPGANPKGDPLARKTGLVRFAECCTFDVGQSGWFLRVSCESSPCTFAELVAPLADGTCCWACSPYGVDKECDIRPFTGVYDCSASCIVGD